MISIIVNHYKSPEMLKLSLDYLHDWQKDYDEESEIIIADSETDKETKEMVTQLFPNVVFIEAEKNIGFGKSVNNALSKAQGEYVFVVNADLIMPRSEGIGQMLEYMENNKDVGIVGPALKNFDESHQPSAFRYYTPSIIALRRTPLGKTKRGKKRLGRFMLNDIEDLLKGPKEVDWIMGSAILTKKEHLDKLGVFDDRYFMYMEDVDLCRRFWENGLKVVYYPKAVMYHFHGAASRSRNIFKSIFNKYTRIHIASAIKYFRKHGVKTPKHGI